MESQPNRDGPLPPLLIALTFVTGVVDAVSYLQLDHVFVANMTGNVVFLGFALGGARDFSVPASLAAMAAFMVGALGGGILGTRLGTHRGRLVAAALFGEILLVAVAFALAANALAVTGAVARYALIVALSLAMGLQNATARKLAVADLTTTVLTLTLTGLAADSKAAGGANPRAARRLASIFTMLCGAALGAYLVLHTGLAAAIAMALALLTVVAISAYRSSRSSQAWTAPA